MKPKSYYENIRPEVALLLDETTKNDRSLKVLELGCGQGRFKKHFAPDVEYWGIEPDHYSAIVAESIGIQVICAPLDECESKLPLAYFDLIICNDVIEHLADERHAFRWIATRLKPDGQVLGSVPNVRFIRNLAHIMLLKDWKYERSGVRDHTHLRFFTLKSIKRTLADHFDVVRLEGINKLRESRLVRKLPLEIGARLLGKDTLFGQIAFLARTKTYPPQ